MKNRSFFGLFLVLLFASFTYSQMVVKNSASSQLVIVTQNGKVGIGTSAGVEPLGLFEARSTNLRRMYTTDGGRLLIGDGLKGEAYVNNTSHYTVISGAGWDEASQLYYSAFAVPGAIAHIYNRSFVCGPGGTNSASWQINSSVYLPKYCVVSVNDQAVGFYQPHVSASDITMGPNRFNVNLANGNLTISGQGYQSGSTAWQVTSDARLKDIRGSYDRGLADILRLNAVRFNYKSGNVRNHAPDKEYVGFIAQEVQPVFPEAVSQGADGFLNFDMHAINVAFVNAFKEQQAQMEALKAENARLSSRISELDGLKAEIAGIRTLLNSSSGALHALK